MNSWVWYANSLQTHYIASTQRVDALDPLNPAHHQHIGVGLSILFFEVMYVYFIHCVMISSLKSPEFWARPWYWETRLHQPCPRVPCPEAQLSAPGVSRAWLKTAHARNTEIRHPETRPARDVKPPQKVRNCTICRHMPPPVRATLTGVTMRSTRRNSVCKQDWINNENPCTPSCCACGLWCNAWWVKMCNLGAPMSPWDQLVVAG